ncbi:hypothetical protein SDC9_204433 [bioreactor metagenome]|uniref:Uncharacterized protein n=1 Tax=bioreactor metagenome TaxID=1076179 RepID=A0A645IZJ5_9ZZZZ
MCIGKIKPACHPGIPAERVVYINGAIKAATLHLAHVAIHVAGKSHGGRQVGTCLVDLSSVLGEVLHDQLHSAILKEINFKAHILFQGNLPSDHRIGITVDIESAVVGVEIPTPTVATATANIGEEEETIGSISNLIVSHLTPGILQLEARQHIFERLPKGFV